MRLNTRIPEGLGEIVSNISRANGESYLVGGSVVDNLQGRPVKDWDIEVYNISIGKLRDILSGHGTPKLVGQEFGIITMNVNGDDFDFSVPRLENRVGVGHKSFEVEFPTDITPKEAAERRDLTINSLFARLPDLEIHDPYGGLNDLNEGILRHTSDKFSEDPLRVLRIMQLLPRKGKAVAPETIELCKSMVGEYPHLTRERVIAEWDKLLMKSSTPSLGLRFLDDCGWIKWYPELSALRGTLQNPDWHPEGDAWEHTLRVSDAAAGLRDNVPLGWRRAYMYGCLLHDVGKPKTTIADLTSYGHDEAGVEISRNFLDRITKEKDLVGKVGDVVRYHMRPGQLTRSEAKNNAWRRLHNKMPLGVLAYVSLADKRGQGVDISIEEHLPSKLALEYSEGLGTEKILRVLMGRHLIEAGYTPGEHFGSILDRAYEIQLDEGISDPKVLLERVN